ncbi:hypothetical protein [Leyella lascolaii]|uniref:Uncharacterized protein n=1 Tax=Leyella lascolaii TaxID=1776379 RepID=A0AAW7JYK7_9BACT|nr:hypothetical protein [Leyella lascolaii]MDN0023766.1 hypothetical protein [Leyella lascolaii]MDN0026111.1 hypothetical protein [Leyella lascolaii]
MLSDTPGGDAHYGRAVRRHANTKRAMPACSNGRITYSVMDRLDSRLSIIKKPGKTILTERFPGTV